MTPPNKPEWIQLAESDAVQTPKKSTRLIPAFIAAAALSIIGVGTLASQISEEPAANATEQIAKVQQSPTASLSVTKATPNALTPSSNPVAPTKPSIAALPKSGGDDEYEGREEHKGRGGYDDEDYDEEGDDD